MDNSSNSGCKRPAVEVIYKWINRWADTKVNIGDPIPYRRAGKSHMPERTKFSTILGEDLPREVSRVIAAVNRTSNDEKFELKQKLENARDCMRELKDALIELPDERLLEPSPTTRERLDNSEIEIPANVICALGVYRSLLISNYLAAGQINRLISEIEIVKKQPGRPPKDPRAYYVAEEMVRLYARVTGEAPPNSHYKDGDYHGRFSPAVDEVCDILGLKKVDLQRPIKNAIAKLSSPDFEPPSGHGYK